MTKWREERKCNFKIDVRNSRHKINTYKIILYELIRVQCVKRLSDNVFRALIKQYRIRY